MKYILLSALFLFGCSASFVQASTPAVQDKASVVVSLPVFQASWGLKKALYDKMNAWLSKSKPMRYVAIADMSQHSSKKRLYIFDLQTGNVEQHNVAHGSGSDRNNDGMLDNWSNLPGSNASAEGMYKCAETYTGKHGLSLKLDGLEATNSNSRARATVMHAAAYVKDGGHTGRSWGCPALDPAVFESVINRLKGGSLLLLGN
jgi:hypothetical protein